jgi:hypothetical protein
MMQILTIFSGFPLNIFSWLSGLLTEKSLTALGAILMIYIGYLVKKYLVPLLTVQKNREIAEHILIIADDVTNYFRLKFPSAHWSVWLDRAVDKIIEITGVGRDVADRAVKASIVRKGENVAPKATQ